MRVKLHNQKRTVEETMANLEGSWWLRKDRETVVFLEGRILNVREQRSKYADVTVGLMTVEAGDGVEFSTEEFHNQSLDRPLGRIFIFQ